MTTRRGFLLGLGAALVTAPSIVHACNMMPIKCMDTFHKVWINGRDLQQNPITKIIEVRDSVIHGLDMIGYKEKCDLIQPEFLDVQSIVWSNEINKVDISPAVDHQVQNYRKVEREFIEIDDVTPHINHNYGSSFNTNRIVNYTHLGRGEGDWVLRNETNPYQG